MEDKFEALWIAANNHCCMMYGEFLDPNFESTNDNPNPPAPLTNDGVLDEGEIIARVTAYLKNSG